MIHATPADYGVRECPRCETTLTNVVNPRTGMLLSWACLSCWKTFDPADDVRERMLAEAAAANTPTQRA